MPDSIFSVNITMEMVDLPKISEHLRSADFAKPMQQTCYEIVKNAKKRIRASADVYGHRYKSLAAKTIRDKRREGSTQPTRPLWRTGSMINSLTYRQISKNHWAVFFSNVLDAAKARIHTYEALHMRHLPARQFLLMGRMTATEMKRFGIRVRKYARNVLREARMKKVKKTLFGRMY